MGPSRGKMAAKNKFKMPFLMELDDAVKVMTKGIARRSAVVAFPAPLVAVMKSAAAMPGPLFDLLAARAGKRAKQVASLGVSRPAAGEGTAGRAFG